MKLDRQTVLRFKRLARSARIAYYRVCDRPATFYAHVAYSNLRRCTNTYACLAFIVLLPWAGFAQKPRAWAWRTTLEVVTADRLTSAFKSPYSTFESLWSGLCYLVCFFLLIQAHRIFCHRVDPLASAKAVPSGQSECSVHLGRATHDQTIAEMEAQLLLLLREFAERGVRRVVLHSPLFSGSRWTKIRLPKILRAAGFPHARVRREDAVPLPWYKSIGYRLLVHGKQGSDGRQKATPNLAWSRGRIIAPRATVELNG